MRLHLQTPPHPPPWVCARMHTHTPPATLILQGSLHTPTPTHSARVFIHIYPYLFYKGLHIHTYLYSSYKDLYIHIHTPAYSTGVFTYPHSFCKSLYTHTHLLILQGSLHTHTSTHSKGSLQRTTRDLFRFQPVFFTSTAGSLSSGQKGPCPQSGQKVTGMEPRRTSPVVPGQRALALPAACF